MPNRDIRADNDGEARVGMEDGPFLNVGARANVNRFGVAPQRSVEPDATFFVKGDIANDNGAGGKPNAGVELMGAEGRIKHCPWYSILSSYFGGSGRSGRNCQLVLPLYR
jgi:hypothetical protein